WLPLWQSVYLRIKCKIMGAAAPFFVAANRHSPDWRSFISLENHLLEKCDPFQTLPCHHHQAKRG
ncbi:TPA: hypothetical protein ACGCTA_003237, partial [Vibrio cholerae O1]